MTNITPLKQQWQQELDRVIQEESAEITQSRAYGDRLQQLQDKYKNARRLSKLKKAFVRVTKVFWLHHKQKKLKRHVAKQEKQLAGMAREAYANLGETVAANSAYAPTINHLAADINDIRSVQNVVYNAANQCGSASAMDSAAGVDNAFGNKNFGMDLAANAYTSSAVNAINNAQIAVEELEQRLQRDLPQVDGALADSIALTNSYALIASMFGGFMGTFADLSEANQLNNAKYHLNGIADELGRADDIISGDRNSLISAALTEARQSDSNVNDFAATLTHYMTQGAGTAAAKAKLNNAAGPAV